MNQIHEQRAAEIFLEAIGREGDVRREYLDRACAGDSAVREKVERLLAADVPSSPFLTLPHHDRGPRQSAGLIEPGTFVGHYEIVRFLASGGMGVVYLARDTRLDRLVAIKALPDHLANDASRLERFEREAKVLASLNHSNIAAIYGLEEHERRQHLVLEYVEGESLAERLKRGSLPIDEAIEIAVHIAEALEAAHEKGVIHRDLKPGNIMITPDGGVKVLDFGLARMTETPSSMLSPPPDDSPTPRSPDRPHSPTIPGAIMGTAGYMSPEQVRGKSVDKRSDIFSFGCVLYEMLTGDPPFRGETLTDRLAATLHYDVDLSLLPPNTPVTVRRVLERCLSRDRKKRLHDIADARIDLELAGTETDEDNLLEVGQSRAFGVTTGVATTLFIAVPILIAAMIIKPWARHAEPPPAIVDMYIALPEDDIFAHRSFPGIAISPNGRTLAFPVLKRPDLEDEKTQWLKSRGLKIRHLDQPHAIPLAGTPANASQPCFSPDGQWIAFVADVQSVPTYTSGRRDVFKIPVSGGRPVRLGAAPEWVLGLAWTDDGWIIAGQLDKHGLMQIPATGGSFTPLTELDLHHNENAHGLPHILPGGRGLLLTVYHGRLHRDQTASIWGLDRTTGQRTLLVDNGAHAQYANGHIVFVREGGLMAAPFDLDEMRVTGDERPLGESVVHSKYFLLTALMTHAGQFAVSPGGTLALAEGSVPRPPRLEPVWVDRSGEETPLDIRSRDYKIARIMPDGERVLFSVASPDKALWMHEVDRGVARRIANPGITPIALGPGPDEVTIHVRSENGNPQLGVLDIGGRVPEFTVIDESIDHEVLPVQWTPDGRHLVAVDASNLAAWPTLMLFEREKGWTVLSDDIEHYEAWPAISPDGRWLAYVSNESGPIHVYVRPLLEPGPAVQVSITTSTDPVWSWDGTELLFRTRWRDGQPTHVYAAEVSEEDGQLRIGEPVRLFTEANDYIWFIPVRGWDVAPDGRFLFHKFTEEERYAFMEQMFPDRIRLIQNWASRLGE
jgi:eukaryotic-like serine/threonine-protein kinase